MTGGRRFSTTSVDESENHRSRPKYFPEIDALRKVGNNVHPDDYPCFVLQDTTVYLQDGKTIANLLNAELQGPFVVRGRLFVDGDFTSRLYSKKSNGQHIEIARCESFSIGDNPITLWALGESGWLEIQPSEAYQKTYNQMAEAISIFYFITDLFEKEKRKKNRSKTPLNMDKILLKYAIYEGTGLVRSEAAKRIKSHAQFLLSQMRKVDFGWKSTEIFKWLSGECIDIYTKLLQKTGETVSTLPRIHLAVLPIPIPQPTPPPEPPRTQTLHAKAVPLQARPSNPPQIRSTPALVLPSQSPNGTPSPSDLPEICDPLTALISLLRAPKLDIRGWSPPTKMTFSKLGTLFYYAYTIKGEPVSQEIIRLNASAILSSLSPEWKAAPLYAQLKEAALKPTPESENKAIARSVTEIKRRGRGGTTRTTAPGRPSRRDVEREHGSKSLYPPQSGRRSGKEAGLRLAPSPAMKRPDRADSEEDDGGPRKRRRPSPPEMGDDSETGSPTPASKHGPSESDISEDESPSSPKASQPLTNISEVLPTLSPSGPNGTWKCSRSDCSHVVRDAESESGREKIRRHFLEHAERLEKEDLARQEAAQRRLPIEHLLEKLRGLGEERRLAGGEIIGDRVVPVRIKKERGMVV